MALEFEEILPYVEGEGDTGKTAREKINRNFTKIKPIANVGDIPNHLSIRNRKLRLEIVSTGSEPVVLSEVNLPADGGQTVIVQRNEDSPSIVRPNTDTSKPGRKVIPLGTSAENLFKNGIRQGDADVYNQSTYDSDDGTYTVYHIKYEFDLQGNGVEIPANSILKFEGGCIKDSGRIDEYNNRVYGTLVGNNTKVEVDGTYTIFDNISFSGTFRDSNLYATNFGAIGNMESVRKYLTFKNLVDETIYERTRLVNGAEELNYNMAPGTESHDYTAFKKLCQFLSGSSNIHITLNGEFYVARLKNNGLDYEAYNSIGIVNANNLTIEGGTTTAAWQFRDCDNVLLCNTNYVGFHEKHIFPFIATDIDGTYTDGSSVKNYSDMCVRYISIDGVVVNNSKFGLAEGISFLPTKSLTVDNLDTFDYPEGFTMRNCHVEMRGNGIVLGQSIKASSSAPIDGLLAVKNCRVESCDFDHIKIQALSLHGVNTAKIDNCSINYCSCPTDIGTGCTNVTIENIVANHCAIGIKEAMLLVGGKVFPSGSNIISNYSLTIDDVYPYKRVPGDDYYILRLIGDSSSSAFKIENSTFIVNRYEEPLGAKGLAVMSKAVRIEANVQFNNCQFVFGRVKYLFSGDGDFDVNFNNCKISIEDDYGISNIFTTINSINISSSIIDYKDNGEAAKAPAFSADDVGSLNIENSEIYFRKGTSMGMNLSANTVFKQNKIFYNNSNGSYVFVLSSNVFIDSNIFDVTVKSGIFVINGTCENVKINKNTINTNAGITRINSGAVDGIEIKDNIINYTNTGNVTSVTPAIINLGSSTDVVIEGNVFKGSVARKISDFVTYNSTIVGSLVDDKSRNTFANIPAASSVRQGFLFYDTTNNRFLISDGTQWLQVTNTPLQA